MYDAISFEHLDEGEVSSRQFLDNLCCSIQNMVELHTGPNVILLMRGQKHFNKKTMKKYPI